MNDPIILSITIMTHPKREDHFFRFLKNQFEEQIARLKYETSEDQAHLSVVSDDLHEGVWTNAKRGWLQYFNVPGATHHLLIQDDVILCQDFIKGAFNAIRAKPDKPIGFYCPRKIIDSALAAKKSWVTIPDGAWGQSNLLPVRMVNHFLKWEEANIQPAFKHDDSRLALYFVKHKEPAWITAPSLIEHVGHSDSLLGQNNKNKVARHFIGRDESALLIDFTKGANDPVKAPNGIMQSHYNALIEPKPQQKEGTPMNIVQKHIDEIRPYWRNPRKNEKAVEAVKKSIEEFGYNSPIVVDAKGIIIAGHTRYKALRQLGYSDINVIVLDLSEDKAKQYRIADNKSAEKAEWDQDLLMFELREIEELQDMTIFFEKGELDKFFDIDDEAGFAPAIATFAEFKTAVVQEFNETPSESDRAEYDRKVEERVQERMIEESRRVAEAERQKAAARLAELEAENEKIKKQEEEMKQQFSNRAENRQQDLVKVECPHCTEAFMLSKAELLRKDKFTNG